MADPLFTLDAIFCEAIELRSPEARADYVSRACAGDETLRRQVESLVAAHFRAGSFLDQPITPAGPTAPWTDPDGPGTVIGPYRLLEQIGEGGMGVVYVAEQTVPVRRRVALKVIKPGMDTRQVVTRFEAERQALALMDHPNIAKILDGGWTGDRGQGVGGREDGSSLPPVPCPLSPSSRPYFVMELVRGMPITDYCDRAGLSPRDRLKLFAQVCRAVQHAHMKGVIHRDLKPSNVLITLYDGTPVPKVIDFGVAKAIGQPLTDASLYTRFAQMVGTPLYMAPEQAELSGLDVDTRADVYSLGVLLYELLTGTTPFDQETVRRAGLDEIRRMIREDEPPRPSQRLSTLRSSGSGTGNPGPKPQSAIRIPQLKDLDWVAMKCLEKSRDRRYDSVGALAADVERYLADEPVEARPPTAWYRARKFWRRNRRALATAGLVAAALVAATVVSTWQAVDANAARKLADERLASEQEARRLADERLDNETSARRQAATDAAIARAVNEFLQVDLLRQAASDPGIGQNGGDNPYLTVREALDRASARIDERFRDQPLVEAAIRAAIGDAYASLAERQRAALHLEKALVLRQQFLGRDHPDTLESMRSFAGACNGCGRFADAISVYRQLWESSQARFGPDHPQVLRDLNALAGALRTAGQLDEAAELWDRLLARQRLVYGPKHPTTLGTLHSLAFCYYNMGQLSKNMDHLSKSIALHKTHLEYLRSTPGLDHGTLSWPLLTFAVACQEVRDYDRAESLLRESLEICRKRSDSHRARLSTAQTLGVLAEILYLQQRYDAAEPMLREALLILNKQLPAEDPRPLYYTNLLGAVLCGQGKYPDAEPLLLQGYEGMKRREALLDISWRNRLPDAGERVVHFYEVTGKQEKVREWREKLSPPHRTGR